MTDPNIPVVFLGTYVGLTKREYFTAMILQGILANPIKESMEIRIKASVKAADALISELNRTTE